VVSFTSRYVFLYPSLIFISILMVQSVSFPGWQLTVL
jgi:hypothetical protein